MQFEFLALFYPEIKTISSFFVQLKQYKFAVSIMQKMCTQKSKS